GLDCANPADPENPGHLDSDNMKTTPTFILPQTLGEEFTSGVATKRRVAKPALEKLFELFVMFLLFWDPPGPPRRTTPLKKGDKNPEIRGLSQ
ncbi:hypothetical protein K8I31_00320, partial [bacterium]|nr:hypothetical protein [bacterium]